MITQSIDNILVEKANRKMHLRHGDKFVKTYKISLGKNPVGAKVKSGDNKTPEGKYFIAKHNPKSAYHLSLKISYPNEEQTKAAKDGGYEPGGDIMIHGFPNKIPAFLRVKLHLFAFFSAKSLLFSIISATFASEKWN